MLRELNLSEMEMVSGGQTDPEEPTEPNPLPKETE